MKQELSPEHRVALIQYRFERAYKTLEEADYMRVGNYFNAAINRLYYACFYAATGLLIAKGIEAGTHNGVKTMLSYHFVRTGVLSLEHGSTFSNLFDKRHSGDYEDWLKNKLIAPKQKQTYSFCPSIVFILPLRYLQEEVTQCRITNKKGKHELEYRQLPNESH